jgi:hypothetical protein
MPQSRQSPKKRTYIRYPPEVIHTNLMPHALVSRITQQQLQIWLLLSRENKLRRGMLGFPSEYGMQTVYDTSLTSTTVYLLWWSTSSHFQINQE